MGERKSKAGWWCLYLSSQAIKQQGKIQLKGKKKISGDQTYFAQDGIELPLRSLVSLQSIDGASRTAQLVVQSLKVINLTVLFFFKKILVYMENEGQNRRWFESEIVKITFSKCWFHECKVKIPILDKCTFFDHLSLLQHIFGFSIPLLDYLTVTWSFKMTFSFVQIFCY